ncbi:MAG TPA: AraC family transcriptional regulator, partial [Chitinophagaceae bacterium]|nr:AraC family transcriptional regulator [Chitinophagaceae bacterium]
MRTGNLPVKQFTLPFSIQLTSFHHNQPHSSQRPDSRPHRHKYYEILYFKEAVDLTHQLDTKSYEIAPGCLFFIAPRQVHFLTRIRSSYRFEIYVITFSEDFLAKAAAEEGYIEIINELFTAEGILSLNPADPTYEILWHQIQSEINQKDTGYEKCICNQFRNLMIYLKRQQQKSCCRTPGDRMERVFYDFQQLVEQHYMQQWTVQQYAQAINKTPKQLNRLCNNVKGCSPQRYIHEHVNTEAKRYLSHSLLQIKEIARVLGFDDQAYFSRFYKKINNESPEKFRSRMAQKA